MNEGCLSVPFIATAGLEETGVSGFTFVFIHLVMASVAPIYWISRGSWITLLGLFVTAIDIWAAVAVSRRAYRLLHDRWRIPDWFVGVPLLLIAFVPIPIINVAAFLLGARTLPSSFFP